MNKADLVSALKKDRSNQQRKLLRRAFNSKTITDALKKGEKSH